MPALLQIQKQFLSTSNIIENCMIDIFFVLGWEECYGAYYFGRVFAGLKYLYVLEHGEIVHAVAWQKAERDQ